MLRREALLAGAIEAQRPLQLGLRCALARGTPDAPVDQTFNAVLRIAVAPAPKRPLADPQQLGPLHLAQLATLGTISNASNRIRWTACSTAVRLILASKKRPF